MNYKKKRYAPYRRIVRSQLSTVGIKDQNSFKRWLDTVKTSKSSQQTDLPSSQLPPIMSQINPNVEQLFVVVDTCSIVAWTHEFMDFVTNLKQLHLNSYCPIKFIVCLTVLEELDKCNRPIKKRGKTNNQHEDLNQKQCLQWQQSDLTSHDQHQQVDEKPSHLREQNLEPPISDLLQNNSPPRLFMRFIEEEMRIGTILIGELDPYKKIKLDDCDAVFEIVNKDDRILECCIRSWAFIRMKSCNPATKLILVSEDNIFKAKASTFGVPSFRWREFEAKYRNFGQKNCVPTPMNPSELSDNFCSTRLLIRRKRKDDTIMPLSCSTTPVVSVASSSSAADKKRLIRRILNTGVVSGSNFSDNETPEGHSSEEISIVKEVINII